MKTQCNHVKNLISIPLGTIFSGDIKEEGAFGNVIHIQSGVFMRINHGVVSCKDSFNVLDTFLEPPYVCNYKEVGIMPEGVSMKIRHEENTKQLPDKPVKDITIGTVFSGMILCQSVYLKTYDSVVDLTHPFLTWHLPPEESDGRSSLIGVSTIHNYKELNAEVVVYED